VASGQPLEPAAKHPLGTANLTDQLGRLGDTPYELAGLTNQLTGDCHFPLSQLNRLRRALIERITADQPSATSTAAATTTVRCRDLLPVIPAPGGVGESAPRLSVLCRDIGQLEAAIECGVETVYCDFEDPRRYPDAVTLFKSKIQNSSFKIHLATPRILKPGELGYLKLIERAAPDGLLLRNLGALHHYRERDSLIRIGDFSLNAANPLTARLLMERAGLEWLTISYDLNIGQVLDLLAGAPPAWFELTLHQHMPMFHMEHCVFCAFLSTGTTYKDCGRPCEHHVVHLRDRVGQDHRLQADVGCRNTLFNGKAQTGARFLPALIAAGLRRFRVELLDETRAAAADTIHAYQQLLAGSITPDELIHRVHAAEKLGVTEGTLAGNR
ncbi:MAG: DUF3656 domain-containing protein, partial [Akkermansiaceae bacterium]|nr:DUF3656 domain-containing protein [Akkermansiaceae bacterium]